MQLTCLLDMVTSCRACLKRAGGVPGAGGAYAPSALAAGRESFLTASRLDGAPRLRAAFSSWRTTPTDVDGVFHAVDKVIA
ncbi:hypothetical protein [Streptomyces sp. NPDC086777]|uniref:hypothetical protein n=1 Tax=Streptomyces sp. NPDC086777 TaxID=3154866 RepID=UPI00344D01DA